MDAGIDHEPPATPEQLGTVRVHLARAGLAAAVFFAAFWIVLPQLVDYGQTWETLTDLGAGDVAALTLVGGVNLFTYWPVLVIALPGLTLREAAVVNQASTAVANTVPAGAAVALGVTYRMLRAWGFTRQSITNQIVLTGLWNNFVKLGLPVVAVAALAVTGELDGALVELTAVGLGVLVVMLAAGTVVLRAERSAARLGAWIDQRLAHRRVLGRLAPSPAAVGLPRARRRIRTLVHSAAGWLSVATVISHLSLYSVLVVSLRAVGVGADDASWVKILAAFAFVRLLSAVPVTPGGVGVVELGYVGFLGAGRGDEVVAAITGGVLLFRAITYALPIVLGAAATVVFRAREDWHRDPDSRGTVLADVELAT